VPTIAARVTFLSPREGGRQFPAANHQEYRPHVVVGDPTQRKALTAKDGRTLIEEYLGVCFTGDGRKFLPGRTYDVTLKLIYHPQVNYDALTSNATFTIREGGTIVGFGKVL
jgi:hypothetical protein